ncbi:MAG: hypothetical protein ABGZ49_18745 [Akkermansiaceae bacterium]
MGAPIRGGRGGGAERKQSLAKLERCESEILRSRKKIGERKRKLDEAMRALERKKKEAARFENMVLEMPKNHKKIAYPEPIEDLWDGLTVENGDLRVQRERVKERP